MNILEEYEFNVQISTRKGTYIASVQRSGEILELVIEEPSAARIQCCYAAGKLDSREKIGDRYHHVESLRWIMEEPVFGVVNPEIHQVGTEAVEAYLQYEREGQVNQG